MYRQKAFNALERQGYNHTLENTGKSAAVLVSGIQDSVFSLAIQKNIAASINASQVPIPGGHASGGMGFLRYSVREIEFLYCSTYVALFNKRL